MAEEKQTTEMKTAIVNGNDLSIGIKPAVAICNYIKDKDVDTAIRMLEQVATMKKAVPMRGEIPHRKGAMMSGRYPVKASLIVIKLLKSLKSNAIVQELELEKYKVHGIPNVAPRPFRRFGTGRFKRSHIVLKLIPRKVQDKKNKNKEKKQ